MNKQPCISLRASHSRLRTLASRHSSSSAPHPKSAASSQSRSSIISRRHAAGQLRPTCHPLRLLRYYLLPLTSLLFRSAQQRACWGDVTPCRPRLSLPSDRWNGEICLSPNRHQQINTCCWRHPPLRGTVDLLLQRHKRDRLPWCLRAREREVSPRPSPPPPLPPPHPVVGRQIGWQQPEQSLQWQSGWRRIAPGAGERFVSSSVTDRPPPPTDPSSTCPCTEIYVGRGVLGGARRRLGITGSTPRVSEMESGRAPNGELGGGAFNACCDRLCSGPSDCAGGKWCPGDVGDWKKPQEGASMGNLSLRFSGGDVCPERLAGRI